MSALQNAETALSQSNFSGGPKKDDEEEYERIKISEKDKDHIFRDAEGHFAKDIPEARKIIENIVSDKKYYDGLDKYGTQWYSKIMSNGKQIWAGVRNHTIRYAGINDIPLAKGYYNRIAYKACS
jgi:hypothetical protein